MAKEYGKCPNCGEIILIADDNEADICSRCQKAFITEKAIKLYNEKNDNKSAKPTAKKGNFWKSFWYGVLITLKCIGYLIYVLSMIWLIMGFFDGFKKSK